MIKPGLIALQDSVPLLTMSRSLGQVLGGERRSAGGGSAAEAGARSPQLLPQHSSL